MPQARARSWDRPFRRQHVLIGLVSSLAGRSAAEHIPFDTAASGVACLGSWGAWHCRVRG